MRHGFIKVAAATPKITVADTDANLSEILKLHKEAEEKDVKLLVFPELCLTGATCGDLFMSDTLLRSAENALSEFLKKTQNSDTISIIGFPLNVNEKIYNSALICQKGNILGAIPKRHGKSQWDNRSFSEYCGDDVTEINLCGKTVTFGVNQLFACQSLPQFSFCVEIGDSLASAVPPSTYGAANGATLVANPCASYDTVTSEIYRKTAVASHSARCLCGYILSGAGEGESTTDFVFGGHSVIAESGSVLAEHKPFAEGNRLTVSEIDVFRLSAERRKNKGLSVNAPEYVKHSFECRLTETTLTRKINTRPFAPDDKAELDRRCETVLSIQAQGLAARITKSHAKKCVIGISGGLDSCLALLATVRAMKLLGRPSSDTVCVTMPCFGTTQRTRENAELLCEVLGCELRCIDISKAVRQHFSDIGHSEEVKNATYENSQARERTQIIMDIANSESGLAVGTGDLSELALGWATYNGDHMSMYGVNADVPKTLVKETVAYSARVAESEGNKKLADTLRDIVDTPVSPELLPADGNGKISQKTEELVGPYEVHDFYIYNTLRYGYTPDKLYRMAKYAFGDKYSAEELKKWLINFLNRFFTQQFKRSCLPDGPQIGAVGLSPRTALSMPSDATPTQWLNIANKL